jgi:hypothetical protein
VRIVLRGEADAAAHAVAHAKAFPVVLHGRTLRLEESKRGVLVDAGTSASSPAQRWRAPPVGPAARPLPHHPVPVREAAGAYARMTVRVNRAPCRKLIVSNLPHARAAAHLERTLACLFSAVGSVVDMHLRPHAGVVHVEYPTADAAVWAADALLRHAFVRANGLRVGFALRTQDAMRTRTAYVANWPTTLGVDALRAVFRTQPGFQACLLCASPPLPSHSNPI